MPWAIELAGAWFSDTGWRRDRADARTFATAEGAHRQREKLLDGDRGVLPGEIHVKEVEDHRGHQ